MVHDAGASAPRPDIDIRGRAPISTFNYAADGRSVFGFDMTLPAQRYGEEPERFAAELERAGFLAEDIPRPSMGAAFIEDVFGITLEPELPEQPLPMVALD